MLRRSNRLLHTANHAVHDPYNSLISAILSPPALKTSGALAGFTFVAKDNICTENLPTTCASKILSNYLSPFSATVINQLENAGLVLVGKSNMDEFGMGLSTMFSHYGASINPRFTEKRICGGSSGGSAAAVASGIADFALGTDTGGSIRQPASYCGIIGFKPSYGRLSRFGVIAYGQGFDCVGVLANDVNTTRKVFETLDVYDPQDITSMSNETRHQINLKSQVASLKNRKLRIGVPKEFLLTEVHEETTAQVESILHKLIDLGHSVYAVSIPSVDKLLSAYYTLATVEAASNMSRFEGIRYGRPAPTKKEHLISGNELIYRNRLDGLGTEVQRRITIGNYTLSSESGDNFYRATRLRRKLVGEFDDVFASRNPLTLLTGLENKCDILIGPSASGRAPLMNEYRDEIRKNFLNEYLNDVYTVPASMAGLPAISVPCADKDFGVQVIGQYGDDSMVLFVAELIESIR